MKLQNKQILSAWRRGYREALTEHEERFNNPKFDADMLSSAIALAVLSHASQVDKAGKPYIFHALRVMMRGRSIEEQIVGVLHDTIEDTALTLQEIAIDFGALIAEAVGAMSRREGESYEAFIRRCKENRIARQVKVYDLDDNMDLSRIENPTSKDYDRTRKYINAKAMLLSWEDRLA